MNPLRAIIVDDEQAARDVLHKLLHRSTSQIKVICTCPNLEEGIQAIRQHRPQVVFLDMQMPNYMGYEIAAFFDKIDFEIVFVTAYDQYAVKAFAVDAIDYLLKPLEEERFSAALARARRQLALEKSEETTSQIMKMLFQLEDKGSNYRNAFELKVNGRSISVDTRNIIILTSNGNYIDLITDERKYLYRGTMQTLVRELNPNEFIRVHRSHIVNVRYIRSCHYLNNNEYKLQMKNGLTVVSGRGYKDQLTQYLEKSQNG